MTNKEIVELLLNEYPLNMQEEWDNSSFINNKIELNNKVCIALDINIKIIEYCIKNKIGLLITHHPIFIGEINILPNRKEIKKILLLCKKNNISILSLHTNFDKSSKGMNIELAKELKLNKIKKIGNCYGVIGKGTKNTNIFNICDYYQSNKEIISLENKIIYICGGAGSSEIEMLMNKKIDVFISGEIKWHLYNNFINTNKVVIDIGHQAEKVFIDKIFKLIENKDNNVQKMYPNEILIRKK